MIKNRPSAKLKCALRRTDHNFALTGRFDSEKWLSEKVLPLFSLVARVGAHCSTRYANILILGPIPPVPDSIRTVRGLLRSAAKKLAWSVGSSHIVR